VSQGLYVRHGMFPRLPVYMVDAGRNELRSEDLRAAMTYRMAEASPSDLAALAAIDISALGVSREKHHAYLLSDPAMTGYLLYDGGDCAGYAYVSSTGQVGPLALNRRDAMVEAFGTALSIAAQAQSERVSAFLPGCSEAALSVAAKHRMRITLPMVLVSNREFGDWQRYLPRNPGFM